MTEPMKTSSPERVQRILRTTTLRHLLTTVIGLENTDAPWMWAETHGISSIGVLIKCLSANGEELRVNTYLQNQEDPATSRTLSFGDTTLIVTLIHWVVSTNRTNISHAWIAETNENFQEYQENSNIPGLDIPLPESRSSSREPSSVTSHDDHHRTIYMKRDITVFKEIQKRHLYHSWIDRTRGLAKVQGLILPFDSTFDPREISSEEETERFHVDNVFAYLIASTTVKYPSGRTIVNLHAKDQDGQQVFIKLAQDAGSTEVRLHSISVTRSAVQRLTAHPDIWNGSLESFLDRWENKLLDLESIRGTPVPVSEKKEWLNSSLIANPIARARIDSTRLTIGLIKPDIDTEGEEYFKMWIQHLRRSFQCNDIQDSRDTNWTKVDDRSGRRKTKRSEQKSDNNRKQETNSANQDAEKAAKKAKFEERRQRLRDLKLWIEPAVFSTWTQEQRDAHTQKTREALKNKSSSTNTSQRNDDKGKDSSQHGAGSMQSTLSDKNVRDSPQFIMVGNTRYKACSARRYQVNAKKFAANSNRGDDLIDGGCNGGLQGANLLVLSEDPHNKVDVDGIENNTLRDLPIVQCAGLMMTDRGPVIGIFNQYAGLGRGQTVHSVPQIREYGHIVDDVSRRHTGVNGQPGTQSLRIHDEHGSPFIVPLCIGRGLVLIKDMMRPTMDQMEDHNIPKIVMTGTDWNPSDLDDNDSIQDIPSTTDVLDCFLSDWDTTDKEGEDCSSESIETPNYTKLFINVCRQSHEYQCCIGKSRNSKSLLDDVDSLKPNFGWFPTDRIKETLKATTQMYKTIKWGQRMKRHFLSRFPRANVKSTNETIATDTKWWTSDNAADDGIRGHGGAKGVQLFVGIDSKHVAIYPVKTDAEYPRTLEDYIRDHGAPDKIISDGARAEDSEASAAIMRKFVIQDGKTEPYYQNQNHAERKIQDIATSTTAVMNTTGTPGKFWLLTMIYVVMLTNHMATASINHRTPMEKKFGTTPDISKFLQFRWWEPVYYLNDKGVEELGRWAGIAEHVGDELCWMIVNPITSRLLYRSDVRTAADPKHPNLRADAILQPDEKNQPTIDAFGDDCVADGAQFNKFRPADLVGQHFLMEDEDGILRRTRVIRQLKKDEEDARKRIQFIVQSDTGETTVEDVLEYNDLCGLIEGQLEALDNTDTHSFESIISHQGPIAPTDQRYQGSRWNLQIKWDNSDVTWEPRNLIERTDPISVALYARENKLLGKEGWKKYKQTARRVQLMNVQLKTILQSRAGKRTFNKGPQYKYGVRLPDKQKPFHVLDAENNDQQWQEALDHEKNMFDSLDCLDDRGADPQTRLDLLADDYQQIKMITVYDVKHDGRRRARMVAGGHTTVIPEGQSTYSSVVGLRTLRMAILLGELNGLKLWVGDITSAYLMAYTKEKVFFVAGPEWGEQENHIMVIKKSVYGLKTSGKRYHDLMVTTMRQMGFTPCKADPDIWMRDAGDYYEYVGLYVDDLTVIMADPEKFFKELEARGFGLKGVSDNPDVFLGGSVSRDKDGTLAWGAKRYIARSLENVLRMFGDKPQLERVPMQEKCYPELDDSPLHEDKGRGEYQTLIGMLQWTVTLGRFDIGAAVASLSRFRALPRITHTNLALKVFGYLRKYPDGAIRFRTGIPNHETHFNVVQREWEGMVYGDIKEELPPDMPTPKGKPVRLSAWFDANLHHDMVTGRSAMGQLAMMNQTPMHWKASYQKTVETATYSTEFISGRTCGDDMIAMRYEARMLGAPLDGPSWLFGDNKAMIDSSMLPEGRLTKRSIALSYHRLRESVAAGIFYLFHMDGKLNISDVMTKHLPHGTMWPLIKPVLFWQGDTEECTKINAPIKGNSSITYPHAQPIGEYRLEDGSLIPIYEMEYSNSNSNNVTPESVTQARG